MDEVLQVVGSLEPGKLYVIKLKKRFVCAQDADRFREYLHRFAPECRFIVLDSDCEIMTRIPEETEAT